MNGFPDNAGFCHPWRPYQRRVLHEFEAHLADRHFHVVAAPGSGKTVLGLEAVRRLNQPTLILTPTLAIRNQWVRRFVDLFLPDTQPPDWISTDLSAPGFLTVTTCQSLHAAQRKLSLPKVLKSVKDAGVRVLVLDEAHHLRSQWWKCLTELKAGLEAPWLVALTATPPYDVSQVEWNRYIDLCGPVDAEVHVPELVLAGNLCPHQDYVYFSTPSEGERAELEKFGFYVRKFVNDLALNRELVAALGRHAVVQSPDEYMDTILDRSDYFLSVAIFLHETAMELPRPLLRTMGLEEVKLPPFETGWAEVLLNGMLFGRDPQFPESNGLLDRLTRDLRHHGAVDHRQVYLRAPPRLRRLLEASLNKCHSIAAIIELEARAERLRLRAVILCDHIREADLPEPGDRDKPFTHLGVVPVFEQLRRLRLPDVLLGILTGSVVVLPHIALHRFREIAGALGIAADQIQTAPLWHAPEFCRVNVAGKESSLLLEAVTRLFSEGGINVLVGTASLLGEGWDAPAINTLILASAIGTYMTSNQMRGRAIRVQPGNRDKTANIWHLACLSGEVRGAGFQPAVSPISNRQTVQKPNRVLSTAGPAGSKHCDAAGRETRATVSAGADFERLARRFRAFAGIAFDAPVIENGIERLGIDPEHLRANEAAKLNARMCRMAQDRDALRTGWRQALGMRADTPKRMVLESLIPAERLPAIAFLDHFLGWEKNRLVRWWKTRVLLRRARRIAGALLESLCERGLITTARGRLEVEARPGVHTMNCRLHGATTHEESFFGETLRELFDVMQSPRYLLRHGRTFYTVPKCLGDNKVNATLLHGHWRRQVGRAELIYTRNTEGKRALLQAKECWLAGRFRTECESRMHWG